jgi:uncharacterized protein YbaR (Trm112 family)
MPAPAEGGDFETARKMLLSPVSASLPWEELAELVFGESGPAQAIACWVEACKGLLFRVEEGLPLALDDEAVAKEAQKKARKEGEAVEKAAFLDRAKAIKSARRGEKPRSTFPNKLRGTGFRRKRRPLPRRNRSPRLRQERQEQDLRRARPYREPRGRPVLPHRGRPLGRDGQSPSLPGRLRPRRPRSS